MTKLFLISGWATGNNIWDPLLTRLPRSCEVERVEWWKAMDAGLPGRLSGFNGKVILAGWSMGGQIAMDLSRHNPGIATGVITVSSMSCLLSGTRRPGVESDEVDSIRGTLLGNREVCLRAFFRTCLKPSSNAETVHRLVRAADCITTDKLVDGLEYMASKVVEPPDDVPLLAIHGMMDSVIPWQCSRYLSAKADAGSFRPVRNAGHMLPLTDNEELGRMFSEFVQNATA